MASAASEAAIAAAGKSHYDTVRVLTLIVAPSPATAPSHVRADTVVESKSNHQVNAWSLKIRMLR